MNSNEVAKLYDAYYFAHGCGQPYERSAQWLGFFSDIADHIANKIRPGTVLDAGCGLGLLVEALRQRDVHAFGIDISEYAIQNVHKDIHPYCWVGDIADPFPQDYDLIVSIEVVEHMPARQAEQAISNFCLHSEDVLFSSSPFDYKEVTHFNVHPPEHWAELFAQNNHFRDVDFDASFITPWAVRYRRKKEPLARLVREYERKYFLLWKENLDLRNLTVEMRKDLAAQDGTAKTQNIAQRIQRLFQSLRRS